MLGFMKKNVIFVFIKSILLACLALTTAHAESTFAAGTSKKTQVSSHLDFTIVIQPALHVRVNLGAKKTVNNDLTISSATVSVQGNSGSVTVQSALDATSSGTVRSAELSSQYAASDMTLAARGKLVNAQRVIQPLTKAGDAFAASERAISGAPRFVYTIAQL